MKNNNIYIYRRTPKQFICRDSNGLVSEASTCLQAMEGGERGREGGEGGRGEEGSGVRISNN
jgi:hypothetical protein